MIIIGIDVWPHCPISTAGVMMVMVSSAAICTNAAGVLTLDVTAVDIAPASPASAASPVSCAGNRTASARPPPMATVACRNCRRLIIASLSREARYMMRTVSQACRRSPSLCDALLRAERQQHIARLCAQHGLSRADIHHAIGDSRARSPDGAAVRGYLIDRVEVAPGVEAPQLAAILSRQSNEIAVAAAHERNPRYGAGRSAIGDLGWPGRIRIQGHTPRDFTRVGAHRGGAAAGCQAVID